MAQSPNDRYSNVVVAVDKFKGTLTAIEAAYRIKEGLSQKLPNANIELFPMADGGEGSLELVETSIGGERVYVKGLNPLGEEIETSYLITTEGAFIEMAKISGLSLIPPFMRDILKSSTYGLGQIIHHAIEVKNARRVYVAIGGSATNDGGMGMLKALGFRYDPSTLTFDSSNVELVTPHLKEVQFIVASDVNNPLLGPDGATNIYSGQKGATHDQIPILEERLSRFAEAVGRWRGKTRDEVARFPGNGAAGGVGFALHEVLGGEIVSGWQFFSNMVRLEEKIASADLVITGEGKFDQQSLQGKLPYGVAQLCLKHRKPLWLICGRNVVPEGVYRSYGICRAVDLYTLFSKDSMNHAAEKLSQAASYIVEQSLL